MKKLYFLILGIALCTLSVSQNSLSRENYFTIGNEYPCRMIFELSSNTVLISGSDVDWNFSDITLSNLDSVIAMDPVETVFYNNPHVNYNTTELSLFTLYGDALPEQNMYSYYHASEDQIEFAGEWADNEYWEYYYYQFEDAEKYFAFPFYFGSSFSDEFLSSGQDLSGTGWHKTWGTRTVVADGFGTLVMPDKTYSNCLRIKATINYSDSCDVFGVNDYLKYQFTWFDLETNGPILEVELGSSLFLNHARYFFNNPLVASEDIAYEKTILLSPNPVEDKLKVQFQKPVSGGFELAIYNGTGKCVMNMHHLNSNAFEIAVDNLKPGIYFLEVITKGEISTRKFIKI